MVAVISEPLDEGHVKVIGSCFGEFIMEFSGLLLFLIDFIFQVVQCLVAKRACLSLIED